MRLEKVDLNLFVVLDAIYREGSVTKVAGLLNLTQPAVSNALNRLRQAFDDQLFVRTPAGMVPTPVAESVIADVRKALQLLGDSVGALARFDPEASAKNFRLGMNDMAEALVLPSLQRRLKDIAPGVLITSYYTDRKLAIEELKSGSLDLLLDAPLVNAREFGTQLVGQLTYVVAMSHSHPLAGKKLTLEDYLSADHLHVSSRRRGRGQVDIALQTLGEKRRVAMRVQNYLVAERIAQQADLLWTVPRALATTTALSIAEVPFDVEPLTWNLFWHKSADDDPATHWLRDQLSDIAKEVLAV